jgi:hypothetical protein
MTLAPIGRTERLENIRAVGKKETDFSDWLATSAGLPGDQRLIPRKGPQQPL